MGRRKRKTVKARIVDKRIKLDAVERPLNLLDVPVGPLHMIISKVDPEVQVFLRSACNKLKAEHSDCILHTYKSFVNLHLSTQHTRTGEQKMVHNVIMVVAQSTSYFINSGYDGVFTSKLVRYYRQLATGEESINASQMQRFLHEFYTHMETRAVQWPNQAAARISLNQRRLVLTMTMLNLLRQFREFRIVRSGMNLMHWQLQIEVFGVYFGIRWREGHTSDQEKLVDFLTILAELLVVEKSGVYESRYADIADNFYAYGVKRRVVMGRRSKKLTFQLSILAPLGVRKLLDDVLNGLVDMTRPVQCPLVHKLSIQLDVKSPQAILWDGKAYMDICIVPLH